MQSLLIRGARQLITLRGSAGPRRGPALRDLGIIRDGSVLICDGVLIEVGATRRVENLINARGAVEIDAAGKIVMPGFVDCHTHIVYPQPVGVEPGVRALRHDREPDPRRTIHNVTSGRMQHRARGYVEAMARHGTTTVEAKTGCGPDETAELKLLRTIAALNGQSIDVTPSLVGRLDGPATSIPASQDGAEWFCGEFLRKVRRRHLAEFFDLYWSGDCGTTACADRVVRAARALGFFLRIHDQASGRAAGLRFGIEAGAVSVDHLDGIDDDQIAALAASTAIGTLLPAAGFYGDRRYISGRKLVDAGAAVALGSNFNPVESPNLSMTATIALACARMNMTPAEAIAAATINSAHVLRCADRVGSLEVDKCADVVVLDIPDYRELAHHLGNNVVSMTVKRGVVIYERGEVIRRSDLVPVTSSTGTPRISESLP